jgi:ectoine hydroxylase-related dioxygenase (phytanoyl-CoA dioxygenase family)
MFLSLPGAETQEYHQDGVHLNTQYQKPCHAINVFIPLIDLTLKSGPTEFCLGSHFLGQEEYSRDFLETPLVKAGTPVIFDYRLGHKGMCNQSNECRPIVYCTYAPAAEGSEFRDSVNFSRKRYHRIGDLVSQGPTREERARKRKLFAEEQVEQARTLDTNTQSARETAQPESRANRVSSRNSKRKQQASNGESSGTPRVDLSNRCPA